MTTEHPAEKGKLTSWWDVPPGPLEEAGSFLNTALVTLHEVLVATRKEVHAVHQDLDKLTVSIGTLFTKVDNLMALVQIDDADLTTFASSVETQVTAINTAVGTISTYIASLQVPLADKAPLDAAVADLTAATGGLVALEPPAVVEPPVEPPVV